MKAGVIEFTASIERENAGLLKGGIGFNLNLYAFTPGIILSSLWQTIPFDPITALTRFSIAWFWLPIRRKVISPAMMKRLREIFEDTPVFWHHFTVF
ncbi:MAG: hypothetical protein IPL01_03940 [Acidobacteria bacterium]|nr:hypothetical protein [Acidobacteriota bacterium]